MDFHTGARAPKCPRRQNANRRKWQPAKKFRSRAILTIIMQALVDEAGLKVELNICMHKYKIKYLYDI